MLKYGFFDAVNGDRKYNSRDISELFDGIILDGIFLYVGDHFLVEPKPSVGNDTNMWITVGTGMAWFNHTKINNTTKMEFEIDQAILSSRKDAVVLEINETKRDVRIFIMNEYSESKITNNDLVHQYIIAIITVPIGIVKLTASNIDNRVGIDLPFVKNPNGYLDPDGIIKEWDIQWKELYSEAEKGVEISTSEAEGYADEAKKYRDSAQIASSNASQASSSSITNANKAATSASEAGQSANKAAESANAAEQYANEAKEAENNTNRLSVECGKYAQDASASAKKAQDMAYTCVDVANQAKESAEDVINNAAKAKESETNAEESATNALNYSQESEKYRNNAEEFAKESESWAIGGTGTRENEDIDNSKYYSQLSKEYKSQAEEFVGDAQGTLNEIKKSLGFVNFSLDDEGNLVYEDDAPYDFTIDENGDLLWEVAS